MIALIAKSIVVLFGIFLIGTGVLMLLAPRRAWNMLNKAASSPLINFAELTLRLIPAAGLILYASESKYPIALEWLGWFMAGTSLALMLLPRSWHYAYAQKCAALLPPYRTRLIAPLSFAFGGFILFAVI